MARKTHDEVRGTQYGRDWHRRRSEASCEPCRDAWNAISRERQRRLRESGWDRPGRPRLDAKCVECGEPVRGAFRKDIPYHRRCRERIEQAERKRARAADRLERAAAGTVGSTWVSGECAQCGMDFTRRGTPSRFCSTACSRKARPNRRHFKIALRDRLAIYDRDSWTCQLCLEPVDRDLMTTNPLDNWAPSLDHIEPQSWSLIADHSPSNLRLAHRWCNSVRGDLSHYTDADLRVA